MSNHISHASLPYPVKNARYTILVPYLDADGDPTDPTTPDTEVSQDGGAFADAAEEVTTITGTNGLGYVTLTGAEMNNSAVGVAFKVASGPKATLMTLIPRVLAILRASTATAGAAGTITLDSSAVAIDDYYNGCIIRTTGGTGGGGTGGANNQARVITDYVGSTKVASVSPNWETTPDNTTTFDILLTPESWLRYGDLQAWRGAQPNALTSGRVEVLLGAVTAGVIAAASFAANALDAVWSTATRVLTAATNITSTGGTTVPQTGDAYARLGAPAGASVSADIAAVKVDTAATLDDTGTSGVVVAAGSKSGYALSSAGVQAIWDALTTALTTVGSIGKLLVDNINATISSRAPEAGGNVAAIKAKTDNLPSDPADASDIAAAFAALNDPSAAAIADAVWEEAIADHSGTVGSTAEALNAAGAAGDPWTTALPGAYGAGSAGSIIGNNLNATVGSRATQTSVDDLPTNAELATALGTADDAVLAAIAALNDLSQADIRTAIGLASANLDTQLGDLPTNAELAAALATADDAVLAAIAALNNLSQANVRTAVGLATANLDTQLDALPTNAELATALATADDAVLAAIAALNNLSAAQVNAEVVDALDTDTYAEPAAVPAATASLTDKINWLAALARNKIMQTATTQEVRNDADSGAIGTATVSDDGVTFTRGEFA